MLSAAPGLSWPTILIGTTVVSAVSPMFISRLVAIESKRSVFSPYTVSLVRVLNNWFNFKL